MKREIHKSRRKRVNWLSAITILLFLILLSQSGVWALTANSKAGVEAHALSQAPPPAAPPPEYFECYTYSFRFNAIRPDEVNCFNQIAGKLKETDQWAVIDGHRDASEDYGISLARANNARDYLVNEIGIDASRIIVRSFCASCPGDPKVGNRRVDIGMINARTSLPDDHLFFACANKGVKPRPCNESPPRRKS